MLSSSVPNYSAVFPPRSFSEGSKKINLADKNKNPFVPKNNPTDKDKSSDSELTFHHQYFVDDSDERVRLGEFRSFNYCVDENSESMSKSESSHSFKSANNENQFPSLNVKQPFNIPRSNDFSSLQCAHIPRDIEFSLTTAPQASSVTNGNGDVNVPSSEGHKANEVRIISLAFFFSIRYFYYNLFMVTTAQLFTKYIPVV